jgi:8-oxo-dGTP diphosphatase
MSSIECIARGIIEKDGKILLCHGKGKENWFFPGGHIEEGEKAEDALIREIMEEIGEESEVKQFLGASENKYQTKEGKVHEINLIFKVKLLTNSGQVSQEDHLEFNWFSMDELKDMIVFPKMMKEAILKNDTKQFWTSEGF